MTRYIAKRPARWHTWWPYTGSADCHAAIILDHDDAAAGRSPATSAWLALNGLLMMGCEVSNRM
jgi:hypothetical protein